MVRSPRRLVERPPQALAPVRPRILALAPTDNITRTGPLPLARAVQRLGRGLGKVGRKSAHASDITPQQADALELLELRGAVTTSAFAHLLGIDPSTASRNLDGLERAGLIARRHDADDGRVAHVRLTPSGKRKAEALTVGVLRAFNVLIDRVPRADRQRVSEALDSLAAAVVADEADLERRAR